MCATCLGDLNKCLYFIASGVATPGHTRAFARESLHFARASENG